MIGEHLGQGETQERVLAPPIVCRNCGHRIEHHYCSKCGQHAKDHNHGLWQFVAEFLDEFIRPDSKFFRTIFPLLFKPGFLTQQWVAGKRVRYITPLKLYISLSAICFLTISLTAHPSVIQVDSTDSLSSAQTQMRQEAEKKSTSAFQRLVLESVGPLLAVGPQGDAARLQFSEKFIGNLSTANLVLLPIFALLFKILYVRRSRYYVEHLVFALHYCAFFAVGATMIVLTQKLGREFRFIIVPVVLWMAAYLPIAMFFNYRQGIFKTLIKCWIFCTAYFVAIGFVLFAMFLITARSVAPSGAARKPIPLQSKPVAPVAGGLSQRH